MLGMDEVPRSLDSCVPDHGRIHSHSHSIKCHDGTIFIPSSPTRTRTRTVQAGAGGRAQYLLGTS